MTLSRIQKFDNVDGANRDFYLDEYVDLLQLFDVQSLPVYFPLEYCPPIQDIILPQKLRNLRASTNGQEES
jgi:hypothetical protein